MAKWKITHNDLEPSCITLLGTLPLILLTSTNAFLPTFELAEKDQLTIKSFKNMLLMSELQNK